MTTIVYQDGKLYADSCITVIAAGGAMTYEEAYATSLAAADEVSGGDPAAKEEYLEWTKVFFEHRFLNRETLCLEYPSKIISVQDDIAARINTRGAGKLQHIGFCGALNMMPLVEHLLSKSTDLKEFVDEYNDAFVSAYNTMVKSMGDDADIAYVFTQIVLVCEKACMVITPSLAGPKKTCLMSGDKNRHICIGSGAAQWYHAGENDEYFAHGFIYKGLIADIDQFYHCVAAIDDMTDDQVVSVG